MKISIGDVVKGISSSELVEIRSIEDFGPRKLIVSVGIDSKKEVSRPFSLEEIDNLEVVRSGDFNLRGDPDLFLLAVEAERIKVAHEFDPLFAVNSSVVDPLPHQIEAVYRYLLPLPRIRFLLADDTGAGKTIMAGLLLKELIFRGVIKKILIIVPGGLTKQWAEDELQGKFGLSCRLIDRSSFNSEPDIFGRNDDGIYVTSIDYISRNDACRKAASQVYWDLIIVDEAHKLSAYEYGPKIDENLRYQAVKELSPKTDHLLFLTATPHRGRKDTFRRLMMLLDQDLFSKDEHVQKRINAGSSLIEGEKEITRARNRFFLRRLKEEMVDWNNKPLFKPRYANTISYELTPEEKLLYDQVTKYLSKQRRQAKEQGNRNVQFTLMHMQRRLASSLAAITKSLNNRLVALKEILTILEATNLTKEEKKRRLKTFENEGQENEEPLDIDLEDEISDIDPRIYRQVLTAEPDEVRKEIEEVDALYAQAKQLNGHEEAKFAQLRKVLDDSDVIRNEKEKLVIFTEFTDTLNDLTKRLEAMGYSVVNIHGGMNVDERKQMQRTFKNKAKIMIATDAAGEGINLQFCRFLINWDIPWNPNKLEQRMGRIHRYGQEDKVMVYNMVAGNTREGLVLNKILEKLDIMRQQMGEDRVYDVINDLLESTPLAELIQNSIDHTQFDENKLQEILESMSEERAQELIDFQKKKSLTSTLDLRAAQELRDASDEKRLQPLFIERFFEKAWLAAGGTINKDDHYPVFHLGKTPSEILEIAKKSRLQVDECFFDPIVFDKQLVSVASRVTVPENTRLMGPGHPLFKALIDWATETASSSFAQGAVILNPNISNPQQMWLTKSIVQDERDDQSSRIADQKLSVVLREGSENRSVSAAYLLDCVAPDSQIDIPNVDKEDSRSIKSWVYENITQKQLEAVSKVRGEECSIRREYLTTAFQDLILDLTEQLSELEGLELVGEDVSTDAKELRTHIDELKKRKEFRLADLDKMKLLHSDMPEVLTYALILPPSDAISISVEDSIRYGAPMQRDDEVEAIAMKISMDYEIKEGRKPEDVSLDGEHYDVRSEDSDGVKRFIEVKGRAQTGDIILTSAEKDKLTQLGDRCWLYVVTNCKSNSPRLTVIQNPMLKLDPKMMYRQVQYLVNEDNWHQAGKII